MPAPQDRALGAWLGLAVGDAVGTTLEFTARDSRPPLTDMVGGGPFGLAPGGWTDDTAMALALAESLAERETLDAADLMARWLRWWRAGDYSHTGDCFDIGNQTASALAAFERDGSLPAETQSAGNGTLMRLAPVVLFAFGRARPEAAWRAEAEALARDQSRLTHNNAEVLETSAAMAGLLHDLITGAAGREALAPVPPTRAAVRASGWVRHCWEAARWAVATTDGFRAAVLAAANLGEDADTTAAVTGQIAGALYGAAAIPEAWLTRLAWRDRLEAAGRRLLAPRPTASGSA